MLSENGSSTELVLNGIVPAKDVFVISNVGSNLGIISVSDALEALLSFEGKVAIHLSKSSGELVDKVGKTGVAQDSEVIDLDALLNDPEYLNSFSINLGSIENLLIRRNTSVKSGNSDFSNNIFITEWIVLPNFEISDLGKHTSGCTSAVLGWMNVSDISWEDNMDESLGAFPGTNNPTLYFSGEVCLTLPLDEDLNVTIFNVQHRYTIDTDGPATQWVDYSSLVESQNEHVIPAGETCLDWPELAWPILDFDSENPEGFGIRVLASKPGTQESIVDPFREVIDFQIFENTLSTEDISTLTSQILTYPTIASNEINIECEVDNLNIESVGIFSLNGTLVKSYSSITNYSRVLKLNLAEINSSGYFLLAIETNKGHVLKKFYKR